MNETEIEKHAGKVTIFFVVLKGESEIFTCRIGQVA